MSISRQSNVKVVARVFTPWVRLTQKYRADGSVTTVQETWNGETAPTELELLHETNQWTPRTKVKRVPRKAKP